MVPRIAFKVWRAIDMKQPWFGAASGAKGLASLSSGLVLVHVASPRFAALAGAVLFGGALAVAGRRWLNERTLDWLTPVTGALLAFAIYALVSTVWSEDPRESLAKPAYLILLVVGARATLSLWSGLAPDLRRRIATGLLVALLIGLALAAVEAATQQWIMRKLYTAFPRLYKGLEQHVVVVDGVVAAISETNIKRRVGMLVLLVWPMALLMVALMPRPRLGVALALLGGLAAVMVYVGPHQSSQVAGIASIGVALLARYRIDAARRAVAVVLAGWVLLALPLVWAAHGARLHEASWMPPTARHRIVIWNATAAEALKSPILGIGANATRRVFEAREAANEPQRRDGGYIVGLTRHAHNAYVQVWYELGAVGALLLAIAGVALVRATRLLPALAQPLALAQITTTAAVMSSSYGIWQMWFLSSIAFGATLLCAAAELVGDDASRGDASIDVVA